jgi:putative transposase
MPRLPRLDSPGLLHHVIVRGIEKRSIFQDTRDYYIFLDRLGLILSQCSNVCFAWALMPNHIHLLIQSGAEGIAWMMRRLLTSYALRFNLRHQRVGHLFQNRYKSIVCDTESYFLQLIRYIHLNPLVAGLVSNLKALANYPWTGHRALIGTHAISWQATDAVLDRWSTDQAVARAGYEHFLEDGLKEGHRPDLEGEGLPSLAKLLYGVDDSNTGSMGDQRILGSPDFVEKILKQVELDEEQATGWRRSGITFDDVLRVSADLKNVPLDLVTGRSRAGGASDARAMAIFAGLSRLGKTGQQLADQLKISSSAVSRAALRGRELTKQYPLFNRLENLP